MNSYVAVDLETTGLNPKNDRILEIGALKMIDGRPMGEFRTFIDPRMKIPEHITQLTGITDDMVAGQPAADHGVKAFIAFAEELPLLGHNVLFDYSFLKHQAANQRLEFERSACDTLKIARKAFPGLPNRSLEAMCSYYQIDRTHAHRAFDDAQATEVLYRLLKQEFEPAHPEWFIPENLIYRVKRQSSITEAQKRYLNDLIKYHRIECNVVMESLTKSEASRMIDKIILTHGKIER
ncbi:MAG: 3'-5' exonuclease [Lachnospiraceae bacterium]|nr:3'-5' exonuclease [Lachnospiraceae bacterium]